MDAIEARERIKEDSVCTVRYQITAKETILEPNNEMN